jgi:hypothetical protein
MNSKFIEGSSANILHLLIHIPKRILLEPNLKNGRLFKLFLLAIDHPDNHKILDTAENFEQKVSLKIKERRYLSD